ncbi:MAG: type IIL restriction-modification enzyme MmeI, partial [Deferrisomatales bacterium]
PRVAKHRVFVWLNTAVLPDSKVIAIALDDDAGFGVLHSRVHSAWTLATCGWHGKGNDVTYNPTTCFETFPFPEPMGRAGLAPPIAGPGQTPAGQASPCEAIAEAARELNALRERWLAPPEWTREEVLEFPGSADGPWARYVLEPDARGVGTVRYPRLVPKNPECAAKLQKRTLTNLYNQRPAWLDLAHRRLDEAVLAAYGWPADLADEEVLARLLALNRDQAGP